MVASLPTEIIQIFYTLVRIEYEELDKQLRSQLLEIERRAAAAGALASSRTILIAGEAGRDSLVIRCRMAQAQLLKAMTAFGVKIDRGVGPLLLSELGSEAARSAMTVQAIVSGCTVFRTNTASNVKQAAMDMIEKALQNEMSRASAELQLHIAASDNGATMISSPSISINGDGNVVVSGHSNHVNSTINFDADAVKSLNDAMQTTLRKISEIPTGTFANVEDLKTMVEETLDEIQKPKLNKIKLSSAIKGIAETIKFVPALKSAYDAIKAAAALAGVSLP